VGTILYSMSVSLDGFVDTPDHSLDWVHVDEELHAAFNDEARGCGAFLYGRRMYELMTSYWPTADADPAATPAVLDFAAIWKATPKIVFSRTLDHVGWDCRLVRDDAAEEIARLKEQPGFAMGVAGPTLAATLIERGLVDEYRLYVNPVILGAGTPFFPRLERPIGLRLLERRSFASGVEMLHYAALPTGQDR
jgi:dihydrofolate reductase